MMERSTFCWMHLGIDASRESVVGGSAAADVLDLRLTLKANKDAELSWEKMNI